MIKKRIEKLKTSLEKNEAMLVLSDANRLYLTNFKSSAGAVLITKNTERLFVDFRYFEKAKDEVSALEVCLTKNLYSQITELLKKEGVTTIYLETEYINISQFANMQKALSDFTLPTENILSQKLRLLRSVKTEKEIELIKNAQSITDQTFSHILNFITVGKTEKEIALEMEFFMRKSGSQGVSFDFIVVSGKNSSLPHGVPTDKKIQNGDFVTMDFGAVTEGYRSDMTRTVAVGNITDKQNLVYTTVLKAQETALLEIAPQKVCCDIDKAARDVIENAGFGNCFGHGLGHGVGLNVHEAPNFNTKDQTVLQKGMVLTVEPGIYIEDEFGVRIEDMVAITDKDYVNLTNSPKELVILK